MKVAEKVFWANDGMYAKLKAAFDKHMDGCEITAYHSGAEDAGLKQGKDYFIFKGNIVARIPIDGPGWRDEDIQEMSRVLGLGNDAH